MRKMTGKEKKTMTSQPKTEDQAEDQGICLESNAIINFKQSDDGEEEDTESQSNAILCSVCALPPTSLRKLNKCPCKSTQYCDKTC